MNAAGLEAVFLANRALLLGFLRAHGAGDAAEDLLQDLWLRVRDAPAGPVGQPLAYLYRAANNLMLDRYRSQRQATARERSWSEAVGPTIVGRSDDPGSERMLIGRETLEAARAALAPLGPRAERVLVRHRVEGVPQRVIAEELGVSLSTVESDLRRATRALIEFRATLDKGPA
ncbi:RNA polymerase sigma factor [Sphingomonas sp. H39-1-10]|uniref:RNA polymerase sigma factor n=1 Tax=Sphingomonas TaxID=13687 RepID=UPI00087EC507|nr:MULTISPECIES: RNA polymerase sigma factor [Sphingomonas]MDF0488651.1 RNA polymerase sigma factor [Sphingomonas pollutisoli]SDA12544.1 RNA polymerase sigma-70 factor, ECF subfamily [Sphingomonas sp. NFR15]